MPERIKKIRSHSNNITDKWFPQSHSKQKSDFKKKKKIASTHFYFKKQLFPYSTCFKNKRVENTKKNYFFT